MTLSDNERFPVQTNWHVVTGAPCAGKTAVIETLARQGYRVVAEVARAYIDKQLSEGLSLAEIKFDASDFERRILMTKVQAESTLPPNQVIFLDRAIPDSIAYYQFEGLDPAEPMRQSSLFRYKTVFLMERLHFETDRVRSETDAAAAQLETLLERGYRKLGYHLVRVPVMSIARRSQFILKHLSLG